MKLFATKRSRKVVVVVAAVIVITTLFSPPVQAVETTVGPCTLRLDNPHPTSKRIASSGAYVPVNRVHLEHMCSTANLIYVTAELSLRFCGPSRLPALSCPVVGQGAGNSTATGGDISYGGYSTNWAVADSDPRPETGFYVATATYEICLFNGGATTGTGVSDYAYITSDGKVKYFKDFLG